MSSPSCLSCKPVNRIYEPLSTQKRETRILYLDPADSHEAKICCHLDIIDLDDPARVQYDALSYTWGDETSKRTITVNGVPFLATENLEIALRYLRRKDARRALWVDAISIDQCSTNEKNHQIRQMRSVYAGAAQVCVWLGEADEYTDAAMQHLLDNQNYLDDLELKPLLEWLMPASEGIRRLFDRPWWTRAWVIQEIIVATGESTVGCGLMWMPLRILENILFALSLDSMNTLEAPIIPVDGGLLFESHFLNREIGFDDGADYTFAKLLTGTSRRAAKDPRDKIYAILGIVEEDIRNTFLPDYNELVTSNIVYQKAMALALERSQRDQVDLLLHASLRHDEDFPSWCIDFSVESWAINTPDSVNAGFLEFSATGSLRYAPTELDLNSKSIKLTGLDLGTIDDAQYLPRLETLPNKAELLAANEEKAQRMVSEMQKEFLYDILEFTMHAEHALRVRLQPSEAFAQMAAGAVWETLYAGEHPDEIDHPRKLSEGRPRANDVFAMLEKYLVQTSELWSSIATEWKDQLPSIPPERKTEVSEALRVVCFDYNVRGCTLFTTNAGYIGRARDRLQEGDRLCILFGCRCSAIMRPYGESYKLVTFAWVHGVMNSECITDENLANQRRFLIT
ncbi:MAG: hypothetical protein M1820_005980 [Bogoriella megaspora]|nr:MAG: hypothetical protein M1820_005980 [Bogoriella megaspora]